MRIVYLLKNQQSVEGIMELVIGALSLGLAIICLRIGIGLLRFRRSPEYDDFIKRASTSFLVYIDGGLDPKVDSPDYIAQSGMVLDGDDKIPRKRGKASDLLIEKFLQ